MSCCCPLATSHGQIRTTVYLIYIHNIRYFFHMYRSDYLVFSWPETGNDLGSSVEASKMRVVRKGRWDASFFSWCIGRRRGIR